MSSGADWSIVIGILIMLIAIVVAIILYLTKNKFSNVFLIASIATYLFGIAYVFDVYDTTKNWNLIILLSSTIIMFFLGYYISKMKKNEKK